jgi:flagellar biosynthesis/type III secretory pathway protein FliH
MGSSKMEKKAQGDLAEQDSERSSLWQLFKSLLYPPDENPDNEESSEKADPNESKLEDQNAVDRSPASAKPLAEENIISTQAWSDGYNRGREKGFEEGFKKGKRKAKKVILENLEDDYLGNAFRLFLNGTLDIDFFNEENPKSSNS